MTGETADVTDAAAEPDPSTLLDPGLGRGRANALRTCLVTRVAQAPSGLIRFVLGPDGTVVPDLRARLPGRGAWLTPTRAVVNEAVKRRAFQRAFKSKDAVASDLADRIAEGLRADLRQSLSLANKAGVAAVIQASDGSADGRRKIVAALHRRHGSAISCIPVIDDLSNEELDMALGRDHVIHAALVAGVGASGCLARWRRLRSFEGLATTAEEAGSARIGQAVSDLHDD